MNKITLVDRIYDYIKQQHYYNKLEKELPIVAFILLVVASAGGTIIDFFREAKKARITFSKESEKFLKLDSIGESWENIISYLEHTSKKPKYTNFLRGLLTVHSTSGELSLYANNILKESFNELNESVHKYSKTIFSLIEIVMLISIAFMTIIISSALIAPVSVTMLTGFIIVLEAAISTIFLLTIELTKPLFLLNLSEKYKFLNIILVLLSIFILFYKKINYIIIFLTFLSIISYIVSIKQSFIVKQLLISKLHYFAERRRAGLAFQESIDLDEVEKISKLSKKYGIKDNLVKIVIQLLNLVYKYSAATRGVLDTVYYFVVDVVKVQRRMLGDAVFLSLLAILIPVAIYFFNMKLVSSLIVSSVNNYLYGIDGLMDIIKSYYIVTAISLNAILSRAVDNTLFSSWRYLLPLYLIELINSKFVLV